MVGLGRIIDMDFVPAVVNTRSPKYGTSGRADFRGLCDGCVVRELRTTARDGRGMVLDDKSLRARRHREAARDPAFQESYRAVRGLTDPVRTAETDSSPAS
jgi:hypothetical protein